LAYAASVADVATAVGGLTENIEVAADQNASEYLKGFNEVMACYQLARRAKREGNGQ